MPALILVLGDQLNSKISSIRQCNKANDVVLMCEVDQETRYVKHHKKKIALIFSAMRHFAKELSVNGYDINYVKIDDPNNSGSFKSECMRVIQHHSLDSIVVTMPGEYRVLDEIHTLQQHIPVSILPDDRFYCSPDEFEQWANQYKQCRMENFYRTLRKKFNILIEDDKPSGGQWNYDKQNRKPPKNLDKINNPLAFSTDDITKQVLTVVEKKFAHHFGDLYPFSFAINRKQALKVVNHFIKYRLKHFGDYQDAMLQDEPFMYHSAISFYLNIGLLLPKEVIKKVEKAYANDEVPINAAEGFIRQILGWREFIRGIYWLKMPAYKDNNFFDAQRKLPDFFWSTDTKLNCIKQCVIQTKQHAYAHHIQRLMVLGNFLLLCGVDPDEVNEWYLIVYADAFEWVELPNVTGMILFADGGFLASKPYAASGAYINKMSNYCSSCDYNVKEKAGDEACPFNYLYWNFLDQHKDKLGNNQRLSMIYSSLNKFSKDKLDQIRTDSEKFLASIS